MLKQYFLTALRTFRRNMRTTLINLLGLSIGTCAAVVIFLIVRFDFGFDRHHPGGDRIYRVVTLSMLAGDPLALSGVPGPLPDAIRKGVSGLEEVATYYGYNPKITVPAQGGRPTTDYKGREDVVFADGHYFNIFQYHWLAGSATTSLDGPYQVVLTESRAREYFPGFSPSQVLGLRITYDDSVRATVSGVVADPEGPTDLVWQEFISYSTLTNTSLKNNWGDDWGGISSNQVCFVRLSPGTDPRRVEKQIAALRQKATKDNPKDPTTHYLQPLRDLHFDEMYGSPGPRTANKTALYGLLAAGIFLLLLACVNYINLTTAQSMQRAKEIGIRKTLGSGSVRITQQFLGETLVVTLFATIVAACLTPLLLRLFSDFIPDGIKFRPFSDPMVPAFLLGLALVVTVLAGLYPALLMSGMRPVLVLKNQLTRTGKGKAWLRKTLTVFQFVIAMAFVLGTLIVSKQIRYALHKDLGYRKDAIVTVSLPFNPYRPADHSARPFANAVSDIPGVRMVSLGSQAPAASGYMSSVMDYKEGPKEIMADVQLKSGDTNYIRVYNLRLLAGRNFSQSDSAKEYLINETLRKLLGFRRPQDALGHHIWKHMIVGVVGDFHQSSLRVPITPIAIYCADKMAYTVHILLQPEIEGGSNWTRTLASIGMVFKKFYPGNDYRYDFYDETIARFYTDDQHLATLLAWAMGLSIVISCLGLLGLVMFTTRQRTKEIGVRKVLGASVFRILSLLSREFLWLLLLAFVFAAPIAYYGMHKWLQQFADRTGLDWWVFALGGLAMVLVALLTLSFQTIGAARANPVESLRSE